MIHMEIPLTAAILIFGVIVLQWLGEKHRKIDEDLCDLKEMAQRLDQLSKEFKEYKTRVDSLTLRAGFKV